MELFKPNEELLYYVWKNKLLDSTLYTTNNESIEIISAGIQNGISGPDFSNAKIKIDGQIWFGNVEIHVKTSDWLVHQHQTDRTYDSIILHVVYDNNEELKQHIFQKIPTLELKEFIDPNFIANYQSILNSEKWIVCQDTIHQVKEIDKINWFQRLLVQRIEAKSNQLNNLLEGANGNWEKTFFVWICRAFGFKYNAEPFEALANQIESKHLLNTSNIEALLFGVAGLLPVVSNRQYVNKLISDFQFLEHKWSLQKIAKESWRFGGVRPPNSPHIRIAQLAAFLSQIRQGFIHSVLAVNSVGALLKLISSQPNAYWERNYNFEKPAELRSTKMSSSSASIIVINAVIPFLFLYGKQMNKPELMDKALDWLSELKPEANSILNKWSALGLKPKSAADSQAMLELYKNYCSQKKCLICGFGKQLLNNGK